MLRLINIPWWYFGIAAVISILTWIISRKWSMALLLGYSYMIVTITLLVRTPFNGNHFEPQVFWSYTVWEIQREQILWNVIGFIPVGVLGVKEIGWKIVPITVLFSLVIELIQLVSMRGLFEFDDVIHNTIGTFIGVFIWSVIEKLVKHPKSK